MRLRSIPAMLGTGLLFAFFFPLLVLDAVQTLRAGKSIGQAVTEMQEDT